MAKITTTEQFLAQWGNLELTSRLRAELAVYNCKTVTDDNFWIWREVIRRASGRDFIIGPNFNSWPTCPETALHFPHILASDPMMICYTPDAEYGKRDRKITINQSKYATTFFAEKLSKSQLKSLIDAHRALFGPITLSFATTADEIEKVYTKGPRSCMSHPKRHFATNGIHPTRVYESPDIRLAYLQRGDQITARSLVNERTREYTRIYGDTAIIPLLNKAGYTKMGSLAGCGIKLIQPEHRPECIIMPYVDHGMMGTIDRNNGVVHLGEDGQIMLTSTDGLVRAPDKFATCSHCDAQAARENINSEGLCPTCVRTTTLALDAHGRRVRIRTDLAIQAGTTYFVDRDAARANGYALSRTRAWALRADMIAYYDYNRECTFYFSPEIEECETEHEQFAVDEDDSSLVLVSRTEELPAGTIPLIDWLAAHSALTLTDRRSRIAIAPRLAEALVRNIRRTEASYKLVNLAPTPSHQPSTIAPTP